MNKGIYRIAAGVGAAVILVSSATAQAATVTANGTPAPVASDSIAGWPAAPAVTSETAVLIDADTGAVLYDKGMDEYRYPASTTKIRRCWLRSRIVPQRILLLLQKQESGMSPGTAVTSTHSLVKR